MDRMSQIITNFIVGHPTFYIRFLVSPKIQNDNKKNNNKIIIITITITNIITNIINNKITITKGE